MLIQSSRLALGVALFCLSTASFAKNSYFAKYEEDADGQRTLIKRGVSQFEIRDGKNLEERSFPQFIVEHAPVSKARIVEVFANSSAKLDKLLNERRVAVSKSIDDGAQDEVITLVNNGPSENRIDLVFMGDGYTQEQRQLFIDDMQRLVDDMFKGDTFHSYLPLFNVHLVFRASNESGIGKNDTPKDTAYQLYREGNTLRAIYPGDLSAIRSSCDKAPGCDYPVVIGNDPYYGGLGGEVAVSTSSPTSGTVVLRHELGHNFGEVGEEYDGGGYFGANHTNSATSPSWSHWLSGTAKAEPIVARHIAWPWQFLPNGPYTASWNSTGAHKGYHIRFSASGIESDDMIKVTLDNQAFPFHNTGTLDRDFYTTMETDQGFGAGSHSMKFSVGSAGGAPWLSNIAIFELGEGFHAEDGYISAYPVHTSPSQPSGYRPTFESCLMRNMKSTHFCSVCQENNWLSFFSEIKMIDGVGTAVNDKTVTVNVKIPPLGQFRSDGALPGEKVTIRWFKDGAEQTSLGDLASWEANTDDAQGQWEVRVQLVTPEVRKSQGSLSASKTFRL